MNDTANAGCCVSLGQKFSQFSLKEEIKYSLSLLLGLLDFFFLFPGKLGTCALKMV